MMLCMIVSNGKGNVRSSCMLDSILRPSICTSSEYIQGNFLAGMEQISRCRREGEGAADHALSKSILSKEGVGDDTSGIYHSYFFFFLQLSTKLNSVVA
jgi:hypothetical protein